MQALNDGCKRPQLDKMQTVVSQQFGAVGLLSGLECRDLSDNNLAPKLPCCVGSDSFASGAMDIMEGNATVGEGFMQCPCANVGPWQRTGWSTDFGGIE